MQNDVMNANYDNQARCEVSNKLKATNFHLLIGLLKFLYWFSYLLYEL